MDINKMYAVLKLLVFLRLIFAYGSQLHAQLVRLVFKTLEIINSLKHNLIFSILLKTNLNI